MERRVGQEGSEDDSIFELVNVTEKCSYLNGIILLLFDDRGEAKSRM